MRGQEDRYHVGWVKIPAISGCAVVLSRRSNDGCRVIPTDFIGYVTRYRTFVTVSAVPVENKCKTDFYVSRTLLSSLEKARI